MLVRRGQYAYAGVPFSGLGDLEGFFGDAWRATVNVGRVALAPVTGGASLLIPKMGASAPPPPPPPPPPAEEPQSFPDRIVTIGEQVMKTIEKSGLTFAEAACKQAAGGVEGAVCTDQALFDKYRKAIEGNRTPITRASWEKPATPPGVQAIQSASQYVQPPGGIPLPQPGSGRPKWLIPAAIGVGVLGVGWFVLRRKQ